MSSSDYAIRVEGLGKRYRIGAEQAGGMYRYKSLRDSLGGLIKRPMQAVRSTFSHEPMDEQNSFWALNDVNFEVKRGEVVGIIGRNGAGKSTLLKILSRITKPTAGRIDLHGRVGSLLEVGTGFHPELSGRENIYLNGAILGMTRAEVKSKFDEIVAFSEIEKFLDTPVKQYSSGMYMRLAFAVAAHLEPEILVVDEVLAVGDAAFQKKCLGKMKDVAAEGRTVLFVTHNVAAIRSMCTEAFVLQGGCAKFQGDVEDGVNFYLQDIASASGSPYLQPPKPPHAQIWIESISLVVDDVVSNQLISGQDLVVNLQYAAEQPLIPAFGIIINSSDGARVIHVSSRHMGGQGLSSEAAVAGLVKVRFEKLTLTPGDYQLDVMFGDRGADTQSLPSCLTLEVLPSDPYECGQPYMAMHSYVWWPAKVASQTIPI